MKKLAGVHRFYALICDSGYKKDTPLLCGVYPSKREALEVAQDVKDCPCKHVIKKCSVEVTYPR